jgi:hypothetical protein
MSLPASGYAVLTPCREIAALNEKSDRMQAQIDQLVAERTRPPFERRSTISIPASTPPSSSLDTTALTAQLDDVGALTISSASSRAKQPEFLGPTSSSFLFRVASDSLAIAGVHAPAHCEAESQPSSAKSDLHATYYANRGWESPLCMISREEALRLLEVYDEEYGLIYPFINKTVLARAAQYFYDCVSMASSTTRSYQKDENTLTEGILDILKLAIAIAAAIENQGPNELSTRLLSSVESDFVTSPLGKKVELLEIQA